MSEKNGKGEKEGKEEQATGAQADDADAIVDEASAVKCGAMDLFQGGKRLMWLAMANAWLENMGPAMRQMGMTEPHIRDTFALRLVILAMETKLADVERAAKTRVAQARARAKEQNHKPGPRKQNKGPKKGRRGR